MADGDATAEAVQRLVRQYGLRWGIEEFFRLPKTGAGIQDCQLQDTASLGKAQAFEPIETCRVCSLQRLAREAPDTPRSRYWNRTRRPACTRPWTRPDAAAPRARVPARDSRTAMVRIGHLVGSQPSKPQPLPGPGLLWRDYQRLRIYTQDWRVARAAADCAPP